MIFLYQPIICNTYRGDTFVCCPKTSSLPGLAQRILTSRFDSNSHQGGFHTIRQTTPKTLTLEEKRTRIQQVLPKVCGETPSFRIVGGTESEVCRRFNLILINSQIHYEIYKFYIKYIN